MNPNQCAIYVPKIVNIVNRKADIIDSLVYKYHNRRMCLLGNVTGYPGVFQSNPCPYPSKPVPASMSTGFHRYGSWVYENPWVLQPVQGYASRNDK